MNTGIKPGRPVAATRHEANACDRQAALRFLGRRSLLDFTELMYKIYRGAALHQHLARIAEDCASGKLTKVCISCPPRHGKSTLMAVTNVAWRLTNNPKLNVIIACYSRELSERFSRELCQLLSSERYLSFYPPILPRRAQRVRDWQTLQGGSFYATSVGGGGVGRGADLYIVDDPFKSRADANSEKSRARVLGWFQSSVVTRLSANGCVIVIGTRWHEDDLIGQLTNPARVRNLASSQIPGAMYQTISLEAICEHPETDPLHRAYGEALWPENRSIEQLNEIKGDLPSSEFAAQYQQQPAPPDGNIIDPKDFVVIDRAALPSGLTYKWGWDLAVSTRTHADYSVGVCGAQDKAGNFYLVELNRGKRTWQQQKGTMIELAKKYGVGTVVGVESGAAWAALCDELRKEANGRLIIKDVLPSKDKVGRANPWVAKAECGKFFVVRAEWNKQFLEELKQFPHGAHDDQVDAVSVLFETFRGSRPLVLA